MDVSVVIPVYNGEGTLGRALEALAGQDFGGAFEVIVVDDGSVDGTAAVVKRFPSVTYVRQDNAGPAAARNRGAAVARGRWLVFTDADCVPRPDWLSRLSAEFEHSSADGCPVAAVCGTYGIANPEAFLARGIHAEILFRHEKQLPDFPKVFGSYNVALRRDVFEKLGGFDVRFRRASGEDNELSYRLLRAGYKIFFARNAVVDHHHAASLGKYLREQYVHGFWRVRMYCLHPRMASGDGYTFWKDMAEVPLSALVLTAWAGAVLGVPFASQLFFWVLVFFLLLEIGFGARVMGVSASGAGWGGVMFLRSFARTAGFAAGAAAALAGVFRNPTTISASRI